MCIMVESKTLELPENIAEKLRGKRIQFQETRNGVLLKTLDDPVAAARGMLKDTSVSSRTFMERKRSEKELER